MPFELRYHPDVKSVDIPLLDGRIKSRIKTAIESRLATAPHQYGEPLRKTLRGYWKLRVGDYRVVYKITDNTVLVLNIMHRKKVYEAAVSRSMPDKRSEKPRPLEELQGWVNHLYDKKKPTGVATDLIKKRRLEARRG